MTQPIIAILLWFSALGCGLIAGLFFAFSTFIMTALGRIEQASGIAAMNSINSTILRSPFMPLFFGTTLVSSVLAIIGLFRWSESGAAAMLVAGVVYVLGMFGCTMLCNVPLNNALAVVDPASTDAATIWTRYLKDWNFWNHVRTISSVAACALYIAAIAAR